VPGEQLHVDLVERRDDEIGFRGGEEVLVVCAGQAQRRDPAGLRGLNPAGRVFDDEAVLGRDVELGRRGQEDLRVGLALGEISPGDVGVDELSQG